MFRPPIFARCVILAALGAGRFFLETAKVNEGSSEATATSTQVQCFSAAINGKSPGSALGKSSTETLAQCEEECAAMAECQAIVWWSTTNYCWYLDRTYNANYEYNANAWVANKECTTTTTTQALSPSATGDPHLVNIQGEKFDIHDGTHRLVHYPRGLPDEQALLLVDAKAVNVGQTLDCYSVYLQSIKLWGKWFGEDVIISTNTSSPVVDSSLGAFAVQFAHERMDWVAMTKQHDVRLKLTGIMPVTVATSMRKPSGQDAMGGEAITLKVGDQQPVLLQLWSSHGQNQLTGGRKVRYLNLEVQNLPKDSGGILGLDKYTKPSTSKCGLVQEERNLMGYIDSFAGLLQVQKPQWTVSATTQ